MLNKRTVYLTAWCLSHFVYLYAFGYSDYPNQIHWVYTFAVFLLGVAFFWKSSLLHTGLSELALLMVFYFSAFAVVSLWEVFPGTSLAWGKFELIHIVAAVNYYFLGRFIHQQKILLAHSLLAIPLILYVVAQIVFEAEVSRLGYGQQLMLCLPAAVLLRNHWTVVLGIIVMLASLHKTTLIAGVGAVILMAALSRRLPAAKRPIVRRPIQKDPNFRYFKAALVTFALPALVLIPMMFSEYIVYTFSRFAPEDFVIDVGTISAQGQGEDRFRSYTNEMSMMLLPDYFIQGMGYMNFYMWTSQDRRFSRITRSGVEEIGLNLHNSYMTWLLEGGLLVVGCVILIFYRAGKRVRRLVANSSSKAIGLLCLSWCAALLLLGIFHQLHALVQFWGTLGLIFGLSDRFSTVEPR